MIAFSTWKGTLSTEHLYTVNFDNLFIISKVDININKLSLHIIWEALNCLLSVMFECHVSLCQWLVYLYIQTSLAVNCLLATSDHYYHTYAQKWWSRKLLKKKKKNFFFFFCIFTSGRFCLTPGSAGVGLHFREAPGWSGRVHMYVFLSFSILEWILEHSMQRQFGINCAHQLESGLLHAVCACVSTQNL